MSNALKHDKKIDVNFDIATQTVLVEFELQVDGDPRYTAKAVHAEYWDAEDIALYNKHIASQFVCDAKHATVETLTDAYQQFIDTHCA